jgi:hypothetical protein
MIVEILTENSVNKSKGYGSVNGNWYVRLTPRQGDRLAGKPITRK